MRLRSLIGGQGDEELATAASGLGLEEFVLRASVDETAPYPTVEVLAAVVRRYGVDPHWLLTGEYDSSTHRAAMDSEDALMATLREYVRPGPIAEPPDEATATRESRAEP